MKRARVRRKELRLPEPDQFLDLVKAVRSTGNGFSPLCGDAVEFFAYAGPRLNEAAKIYGRDCSFLKNEIVIRGDLITGTKNWEIRRVPMIPEMRKLLERLKTERGEQEFLNNPVLKVRKFQRSLTNCCKQLGLSRRDGFHLGIRQHPRINVLQMPDVRVAGHHLMDEFRLRLQRLPHIRIKAAFGDVTINLHHLIQIALP